MRARHAMHRGKGKQQKTFVVGQWTQRLSEKEVQRFKEGVANPVERFGNPWPLEERKPQ